MDVLIAVRLDIPPGSTMTRQHALPSLLAVLLLVVSTACGGAKPPDEVGSSLRVMRVERTMVDSVVLAVPADRYPPDEAVCEPPRASGSMTQLALRWEIDGSLERRISAHFDSAGRAHRYSDSRGGVTNARTMGTEMPGTMILIELTQGAVLIHNQDERGTRTQGVDVETARTAPELDEPDRWIGRLWRECGAS